MGTCCGTSGSKLEYSSFPRLKEGSHSAQLRPSELAMILDGIDMTKLKRVPRYERTSASNKESIAV
jgi:hypothetical protein